MQIILNQLTQLRSLSYTVYMSLTLMSSFHLLLQGYTPDKLPPSSCLTVPELHPPSPAKKFFAKMAKSFFGKKAKGKKNKTKQWQHRNGMVKTDDAFLYFLFFCKHSFLPYLTFCKNNNACWVIWHILFQLMTAVWK